MFMISYTQVLQMTCSVSFCFVLFFVTPLESSEKKLFGAHCRLLVNLGNHNRKISGGQLSPSVQLKC